MSKIHTRVLVLGGGPAGYTAAIYAARAGLEPVVVTGMQPGGQLTITADVENYPGFSKPVSGPWLMGEMQAQVAHVGAQIVTDTIVSAKLASAPFQLHGESGARYLADALIVATGAKARWLGIPGETELVGYGVSGCATCDGFFFRGKDVTVVGGGNTAVEEALYLSNLASNVTVVHRRDSLRADRTLQNRMLARPNISIAWNKVADRILPDESKADPVVRALMVRDRKSNALEEIPTRGIFVAIGHDPATELFRGQIDMDGAGYILTAPDSTQTSRPGIFAAGDVRDRVFRQAVTAAGSGCMAALEAERWLANKSAIKDRH